MLHLLGAVLALALGIWIGLGRPGTPGREDRVLPSGMKRQRKKYFTPLDLLRRDERASTRRRR
jgi:hypothetical protein